MRVLVTGATGLIGRELCKELLLKGCELVIIGRDSETDFRERFTLPCEYHKWEDLKLEDIQAVFHLAGDPIASGRWSAKKKASILNSRVETTKNLIKAFDGRWPDVFVGASAIGYYGSRGGETLTEASTAGEGFLPSVCKQWEEASGIFEKHCRVVRLRIGVVLDTRGGFLEPMEKLFSFGLGGKVASGDQWISWIHSSDLIRQLIFVMENNSIEGTFNAVAPKPVTNREWTRAFARQLGVKAFVPAPAIALKVALGEMSQLATNSQKVSCAKIVSQGFEFQYESITSALSNLYKWKRRSSERLFESEQWVSAKREDIFPFFSEAKNLEKITPPWLNFKVLNQSTEEITAGTLIDYKISLKGLPMKWRTEIKDWNPPQNFIDNQLKGPYKRWHHTHSFEEFPQGTLMKDFVVYELPLGNLGLLVAGGYVGGDVARIFSYRKKIINKLKSQWEV